MDKIGRPPRGPSGWLSRFAVRTTSLLVAVIPITLLVVAAGLEPSRSGLGTHQQLGLPPCSMQFLFDLRCPSCGMTTSWSHFSRGQWAQSAAANLGGFLLAAGVLPLAAVALRCGLSGNLPSVKTQQFVTVAAGSIMLITLIDWVLRVWIMEIA